MQADDILNVSLRAGVLLLKSGAEVYRVEDTVVHIAESFNGVESAVAYVTATGIMVSVVMNGVSHVNLERVQNIGRDLHRINMINTLSRNCVSRHYTVTEVSKQLDQIEKSSSYSSLMKGIFGAIGAFGFCIFFGGTWLDMFYVFIIGFIVRMTEAFFNRFDVNPFFITIGTSFVSVLACRLCAMLVFKVHMDTMIISVLMLLVPGLIITNAIRDTLYGDYLSGIVRFTDALVISIAIAIGTVLALLF